MPTLSKLCISSCLNLTLRDPIPKASICWFFCAIFSNSVRSSLLRSSVWVVSEVVGLLYSLSTIERPTIPRTLSRIFDKIIDKRFCWSCSFWGSGSVFVSAITSAILATIVPVSSDPSIILIVFFFIATRSPFIYLVFHLTILYHRI